MSEKAAYYSQDVVDRRMALIVEVITDEGISGWGEGFCSGQNPLILKAIVDNAYTPKLIGRDPFDNDVIYETLYNMSRSYGQSGSAIIALSAIDVALWDIKGKALNMPIYKLLGGAYRDGVEPYASGPCRIEGEVYPDAAVEQAKQYVKQGYKAMKFKIGFGVNEDVKLIHAVREAIVRISGSWWMRTAHTMYRKPNVYFLILLTLIYTGLKNPFHLKTEPDMRS